MTTDTAVRYRNLTQELLADVTGVRRGVVSATEPGIVAGLEMLDEARSGRDVGTWTVMVEEGAVVEAGEPILEVHGSAGQLAAAEDVVMGPLGWAGGVAARCRKLRATAPSDLAIACGGWKKLPAALKPLLRHGLAAGGVSPRLVDGEFVYIDKNTVATLGGIGRTVLEGIALDHGPVAIQVTGPDEALDAVTAGAGIIMVDTGDLISLEAVHDTLTGAGLRERITLAYAGGIVAEDLVRIRAAGADVVDLGRSIIDAPLWDLHLVVDPA
jgi:nicotinate-nucleotide pyrophosphorylase (carboxylating)